MFEGQNFKTWNLFDSALTKAAIGHHYWETRSLAEELVRAGRTVRIFTHQEAPARDKFPGAEIVSAFSLYLYAGVSTDPAWAAVENFVVHNRAFHNDLAALDPSLFRDSIALFPTVGERQLLGLFRWLGTFAPEMGPKAAVCLMPPREWSKTNPAARMYRAVWKGCPPALKTEIAIFSRTPQIAEMFTTHIGMPSKVFPLVLPDHHRDPMPNSATPAHSPMIISYLGGSRREKGALLIPDVVTQSADLDVRFLIQAQAGSDSRLDIKKISALADLPNVRVHQGTLERDDFYAAITGSVALLPYDPRTYRWADSSIYHEAKLLDVPVLVTAGTWMAEEVKAAGNGLVIEEFSAAAVVDCIARAQRDLPALRAAATRVGEEFRRMQGVARCLAAVAGAFASPTGHKPDTQRMDSARRA